jgi:branched-chain amino acid transport system ATP-binding protein
VVQSPSTTASLHGELKPFELTKLGIARTFQNIRLFASMSVFDNVRTAVQVHRPHGIRDALCGAAVPFTPVRLRSPTQSWSCWKSSTSANCAMKTGEMFALRRPAPSRNRPRPRHETKAAIARRTRRRHEPTEKAELTKLIRFIKEKFQIAVLLVEHDMQVVMGICERIAVLDYGIKIAEGTPDRSARES